MGYDLEKYKVVGVVEQKKGNLKTAAEIRVIGLINETNKFIELKEDEAKGSFPPKGYVFEPGFFKNNSKFKIYDFISFYVEENPEAKMKPDHDSYKFRAKNAEVKKWGCELREVSDLTIAGYSVQLDLGKLGDDNSDGIFYGMAKKHIIGKLQSKNCKISARNNKYITIWDKDEQQIITYYNWYDHTTKYRLSSPPSSNSKIIDCFDDKQLFEWFRIHIREINPDYVKLLDEKASWRNNLPEVLTQSTPEEKELEKIRFNRIKEKMDLLELSRQNTIDFAEQSDVFKTIYEQTINQHKEDFKSQYEDEINQIRKKHQKEKEALNREIKELEQQKKKLSKETEKQNKKREKLTLEITKLEENKDRIIEDFTIIKEVIGTSVSNVKVNDVEESFVIEEIVPSKDYIHCEQHLDWEENMKHYLSSYNLNHKFSKRLLKKIPMFKNILVSDIKLALAYIKATQNAKYIIQQVEPDWLHFKDLWNNGLKAIWESAHNNPSVNHFLVLEDFNMASPECYFKPLKDVIGGIRRRIPFGKTNFPDNLKIFATIASFEDPEIGLPLYENTISDWGILGFKNEIKCCSDKIETEIICFINPSNISVDIDEFEIAEIEAENQSELRAIIE